MCPLTSPPPHHEEVEELVRGTIDVRGSRATCRPHLGSGSPVIGRCTQTERHTSILFYSTRVGNPFRDFRRSALKQTTRRSALRPAVGRLPQSMANTFSITETGEKERAGRYNVVTMVAVVTIPIPNFMIPTIVNRYLNLLVSYLYPDMYRNIFSTQIQKRYHSSRAATHVLKNMDTTVSYVEE
jgi:hypothetical protein